MVLMKRWLIIRGRMSTLLLPTNYNGQQNIYKKYSSIWYLYTKAEILIDWGVALSSSELLCLQAMIHREKKLSHFDIKSWVTGGTKIRPGKVGNYRIFELNWLNIESNWLNIESQIDSTLRVKLAQHWESSWLNNESQIDSTLRVKLTQIFSS